MAIGTYEQYKERLLKMKPNVYMNGKCMDRSNGKEGPERDLADWMKGGTYVMKQLICIKSVIAYMCCHSPTQSLWQHYK